MKRFTCFSLVGLAALTASIAVAQTSKDKRPTPTTSPATQHELPPGVSEADMQACMEAATPGPMHAFLAEGVGVWNGATSMWMSPDTQPQKSQCTSTITTMMDGRFIKCEITGEMPGMGPFNGFGLYGFDNVSQEFQSTWIDNFGTGMMVGTGALSSDGKTLTWNYTYNCPMTKKPTKMREIERITGANTRTLEMYMPDPVSGEEYKMMEIKLTRKPGTGTSPVTRGQ